MRRPFTKKFIVKTISFLPSRGASLAVLHLISMRKYCKQSFGGTKFENGFEKSKHLVN